MSLKIVADKDIPFLKGVLEPHATVEYLAGKTITQSDVQDADALIVRTRTHCNEQLLAGTRVRFIASATIGFDHIDGEYCTKNGITWTNAAGCNSSSVQQYIAAALFHLADKLEFELADKTIGIVGVGNVGTKVAKICSALGMKVLLNDPPRQRRERKTTFLPLESLVRDADIISFHVPLTMDGEDRTFHLVDQHVLAELKAHQILINTSRGEVVDTAALRPSLEQKRLAACVLDVWENEPGIDVELLDKLDIGTPHIAGYSADGKANGTSMSVQAVSKFFKLGMDDWFPDNLPLPDNADFELDCTGLERQKVFFKLISRTYDILSDDRRLRSSPSTFEQQRAGYPLRREFPAYSVTLRNASPEIASVVRQLGFNSKA
jgi:erythronate-4-phosphate dehydrogenase